VQATTIGPAPPAVEQLAGFAAAFGQPRDEVLARLNAYQYLVRARRSDATPA